VSVESFGMGGVDGAGDGGVGSGGGLFSALAAGAEPEQLPLGVGGVAFVVGVLLHRIG